LKQIITHPLPAFPLLLLYSTSDAQGTFVRDLQLAQPMTQRLFNLVEEWEKYWKEKFDDDKYMFSAVRFYVADKVERGLLDQVHEE
jgi:REP element-mobilizing transposase RayT